MGYQYTKFAQENALRTLPLLVYAAQKREIFTYGEIARIIGLKNHRNMNNILGYIRDEICIPRNLPLLNAIVINQNTKMPGESFLPEGTGNLSKEEYRQKFDEYRIQIAKEIIN